MLIIRKKNIVINEKISERRIKMSTETLNNFETTKMVEPTGMEVTSVDMDMPNNTVGAVKEQFSTGEKIGLIGAAVVGIAGIGYGVYFLAKKVKAKRAAKKAEEEVKIEKDSE